MKKLFLVSSVSFFVFIISIALYVIPAANAAGPICTVNGAGGADYTTINAAIADL